MATSLEESKKVVQIDNIHANTFHFVKKMMKIGPIDAEIPLLNLKKIRKIKYIGQSASLLRGLKIALAVQKCRTE